MTLSAPRTCSWSELMRAADFFLEVQAFEGRALDRAALMDKAKEALARLEGRLSALPDWLTIHELRGSWFIIRPKPETAKAMWEEVMELHTARAERHDQEPQRHDATTAASATLA